MARASILIAFCLIGAVSANFITRHNFLTKKAHAKNYYAGTCSDIDQSKTKSCLDSYFGTYGFDTSKGLPDYIEFSAKTFSIMKQNGANGFDVYCAYEKALETCLGSLMTSACMNTEGFMKMYGADELKAEEYATTYPVESYTCQNIDISKKYFSCMMDMSNDIEELTECEEAMVDEFEGATDLCVPYDHYVTCIENSYVKFCDEGIRSYICNTEEIAFNFGLNGTCADKMHTCSSIGANIISCIFLLLSVLAFF